MAVDIGSATGIDQQGTGALRLRGRELLLARTVWLTLAAVGLGFFISALPVELAQLRTICAMAPCESSRLDAEGVKLLRSTGLALDFYAAYTVALGVLEALAFVALGVLVFWYKSAERIGWLVALMFVLSGVFVDHTVLASMHPAWQVPGKLMDFLGGAAMLLFFYLFPDGRFVPRWSGALAVLTMAWGLSYYFFPESLLSTAPYSGLDSIIWSASLATGMGMQVYRYLFVSTPSQRKQTRWLVFGLSTTLLLALPLMLLQAVFPTFAPPGSLGHLLVMTVSELAILCIPLAVAVAILRYRLWDIDIIINRTLVYGALTASVIGFYVLIVGGFGLLLQARGNFIVSLLTTGLIAVLFQPLRQRLQTGVNRLMYGDRNDPYKVLSNLSGQMERTLEPTRLLPVMAETIARTLKLPYTAIALGQNGSVQIVASYGSAKGDSVALLLVHQGEVVGELRLEPRAGETFKASELRLLKTIAQQASVAAYAVKQNLDLQRSREALVTAREEERLRIRRDLHDGLGPELATLTLKLDAARNLLRRDTDRAEALLLELKQQTQDAVASIRRLVYALRPPALDELGLAGALREEACKYDASLRLALEVEGLENLPAAVDVACYRIVQEALQNVVRHAKATRCSIRVCAGAALTIIVEDDGAGLPETFRVGVGLRSMRERAEELGGSFKLEAGSEGGTRLLATLPL